MENNCLVKKYKVATNNPDLPVLEVMQQITRDAITLSGNSGMTDAQKWALNHFFYQIGAVNESAVWQKMKFLFLPMICGDNVDKALTDYISKTVVAAAGSPTFVNHGLHYSTLPTPSVQTIFTDKFSGNSNDLSVFHVTMSTTFIANQSTEQTNLMIDKGDATYRRTISGASYSGHKYIYVTVGNTIQSSTVQSDVYNIGCASNGSDFAFTKFGSSSLDGYITTDADLSGRQEAISYTNNYLKLNIGKGTDMGAILIASAMTKDECTVVLDALKALRAAFSAS